MLWFENDTLKGRSFGRRSRHKRPVLEVRTRSTGRDRSRAMRIGVLVLVPIVLAAGIFLIWLGICQVGNVLFARNDRFVINRLEVRAASARTRALAREYTQIREGMNLFGFDIGKVRSHVMDHAPNFRSMRISRYLPGTVIIEVVERTPLARIGSRGGYVADGEGHVFIVRSGLGNLPTIQGCDRALLKPGLRVERNAMAALQVVEACDNPAFEMRVESVDVANPEYVEARMLYGDRKREVTLAWHGMGEESSAAQRALVQTLGRIKQAFDSDTGRKLTRLDATIEGKVYGK